MEPGNVVNQQKGKTCKTPKLSEQASLFSECLKTRVGIKQIWYVLEQRWLTAFYKYIGLDAEDCNSSENPGPLDNLALLEKGIHDLKTNLILGVDYALVPEAAWKFIVSWYGFAKGQQPISRKTILSGRKKNNWRVEVYPVQLKLCDNFELNNPMCIKFSAGDLIENIKDTMIKIFEISRSSNVRLWGLYSLDRFELLPEKKSIQDVPLFDQQFIIIESKNVNQQWEPLITKIKRCSKQTIEYVEILPSMIRTSDAKYKRPKALSTTVTRQKASTSQLDVTSHNTLTTPGLSGLVNLGNTCFLNSVVQCLSHCSVLRSYFLDNLYLADIECNNAKEAHGKVAKSFGKLMHMLWSGKYSAVKPENFMLTMKHVVPGLFGNYQQDSQEFIEVLLNLLHKDLQKSASSNKKSKSDELADDPWMSYIKTNQSFITENFHGFLKSSIVCSCCENETSKFEPFVVLSLPLVMRKKRKLQVRHIPFDSSQVIADYLISVACEGSVHDLLLEMGQFTNVPIDQMILAEFVNYRCQHFFSSEELILNIKEDIILVLFDTPVKIVNQITKSYIILPVVLWEKRESDKLSTDTLLGHPFIIAVHTGEITYQSLYNLIKIQMRRYISEDATLPSISHMCNPNIKLFAVSGNKYKERTELKEDQNQLHFYESMGHTTIEIEWVDGDLLKLKNDIPAYHNTISNKEIKLKLEDCLEAFLTSEKLGADEWFCDKCHTKKCATKKLELWQLPPVLIINLKRYSYTNREVVKLGTHVDFPINNFRINERSASYRLSAVNNHYKLGKSDGHYTALASLKKKWYCIDDAVSYEESKIVTSAAYMLFYTRLAEDGSEE